MIQDTQVSPTALEEGISQRRVAETQAEFDRELRPFCELLGFTPTDIAALRSDTFQMLVSICLFRLLSLKLRELDARLTLGTYVSSPPSPKEH